MTGYQIPISLSCSPSPLLLPAVAWRTVSASIWRQAVWIGFILARPCAPVSALGARMLGQSPQMRPSWRWGEREKQKEACKSAAAYASCDFPLIGLFSSMNKIHKWWRCRLPSSSSFRASLLWFYVLFQIEMESNCCFIWEGWWWWWGS